MKSLILQALFLLCIIQLKAQCTPGELISDPSFEGTPDSIAPPGWISCDPGVSVFTLPLSGYQNYGASQGQTYLGLYYNNENNQLLQGAVSQKLSSAMVLGETYKIGVSLINLDQDPGNHLDHFQVWGGFDSCDLNAVILDTSNLPSTYNNNTAFWQRYSISYNSVEQFTYVTLKVNSSVQNTHAFYLGVDSFTLINCSTTGIENVNDEKFTLYPNPANNSINIFNPDANAGVTILKLYDMGGRQVMKKELSQIESSIDISQVMRGIYTVSLQQSSGVYCKKLVIE